MFSLNSSYQYFLYQGHCDMRKSFDGLCGVVTSELQRKVTSGEVFVFLNRQRTHIKLLPVAGARVSRVLVKYSGTRGTRAPAFAARPDEIQQQVNQYSRNYKRLPVFSVYSL